MSPRYSLPTSSWSSFPTASILKASEPRSPKCRPHSKGRKLLSSQTYEIKHAVANGDSVAVEVLWTGTLAVSFGTLTAGAQMRCHSSMFFEFKDGKICSQRNYDCFEPW